MASHPITLSSPAYAIGFAVVAGLTAVAPAIDFVGDDRLLTAAAIGIATLSAGLLALGFGTNAAGKPSRARGVLVMLSAFLLTIGAAWAVRLARIAPSDELSLSLWPGGFLFYAVFGLLRHGWYVIPIGAVVPWLATTCSKRRRAGAPAT